MIFSEKWKSPSIIVLIHQLSSNSIITHINAGIVLSLLLVYISKVAKIKTKKQKLSKMLISPANKCHVC